MTGSMLSPGDTLLPSGLPIKLFAINKSAAMYIFSVESNADKLVSSFNRVGLCVVFLVSSISSI